MQTVCVLDDFRALLESECHRQGVSQAELARRSGVHYVTINRFLRGHHDCTLEVAEKLAAPLGIVIEVTAPKKKRRAS